MRALTPFLCFLALAPRAGAASPALVASEFINDGRATPSCHASTLAESSDGTLVAAWFGGSAESRPDVSILLSRREPSGWTQGRVVADGRQRDGSRYACWNPVLFQAPRGPLLLFYKVGPSPEAWWGMLAVSTDGGRSWGAPRRLPGAILGPSKNKPVLLADGALLCGSSTEAPEGGGWQVHMESTRDLGASWSLVGPLATAAALHCIQPSILVHPDGRLQLLCRSKERTIATSWSSDQGRTWSPLSSAGLYSPNSGLDAVALSDGRFLLVDNWRDSPGTEPPGSWGVRYPLNLSVSPDGVRWRMALTLEDVPCRDGYAYPAVIQTRDGLVHLTYTWNRERIKHVVIDPSKL